VNPDKRLVVIPGNHEYYHAPGRDAVKKELASCEDINVASLLEGPWEAGGIRFIGAVGWFGTVNKQIRSQIADFACIRDFDPETWCRNDRRRLKKQLRKKALKTVVVTHHMPSPKSIHPRFEGSPLNPAFANDWEDLIVDYQPALWVHGHTHDSTDYVFGETRVVCNPFGYYGHYDQNPEFDPGLIVEMNL
jgi:Icc-related predicted phosphoesterase